MSRQATCDRCGRFAPIFKRTESLPIGWMYFKRDNPNTFNEFGDQDQGYDLCDMCYVNIQQEITFAKMARS